MNQPGRSLSFGWIPDLPDFRDYTEQSASIREILSPTGLSSRHARRPKPEAPPSAVDLREWCSPVEDQDDLGSCTANAGVGIIEYYERKAFSLHIDASRLFLYKVTRNLMKQRGDTGAYLRKTIGAMVLFGVPPEEYWPYTDDPEKFDKEPPAFCYSFAQNYKTLQYFRHDPPGTEAETALKRIKLYLAAGHPSMFGFTVYSTIELADGRGAIPFPSPSERILGGHAVVAVGYDDKITIANGKGTSGRGTCTASVRVPDQGDARGMGTHSVGVPNLDRRETNGTLTNKGTPTVCVPNRQAGRAPKQETTGALLIRNSWGPEWGDGGYGWLPYEYILQGLAEDFWSILKKEWVDTGAFNI